MSSQEFRRQYRFWAVESRPRLANLDFPLNKPFPKNTVDSCIALYLTWAFWIPRKTYHFTFVDVETVANTIRWEFELPAGIPTLPGSDHFLLPIGFFAPEVPLVASTLTDDTRDEVPRLTGRENQLLTQQMVERVQTSRSGVARRLSERELRDKQTGYLQTVMMTDPSRLRRSLTLEYETTLMPVSELPDRKVGEVFSEFIGDYDPQSSKSRKSLSLDSSRLAIVWPISGFGDAERSRLDCEAPDELEIEEAGGFWIPPDNPDDPDGKDPMEPLELGGQVSPSRVYLEARDTRESNGSPRPETTPAGRVDYARIDLEADPLGPEDADLPWLWATWRDQPAFIIVFLQPRWQELRDSFLGVGFGSVILLVAAALVLIGSLAVDPDLADERVLKTPLASVVAFTASIATTILIRPDSNEMAGFLLRPIRLRLALLGLLPVLAAITITIPVPFWINGVILLALAVVELAYTLKCRDDLRPQSEWRPREPLALGEVKARLASGRCWFCRDTEMFREFKFEEFENEKRSPLTDRALLDAAQEFADGAGWTL